MKVFKDIPYAAMTKADQWNNGNNTPECYGHSKYKGVGTNGMEELKLDIYMPDPSIDKCPNRGLIILAHPGGFGQVNTPNKASVASRAKFMAQLGFVVASIDYRKGFDFRQNVSYDQNTMEGPYLKMIKVNCKESNTPDPNTFSVAMFRLVQDIRAAHRFLHKNSDKILIDPNKIFYAGLSTGAVGAAQAAYGHDEAQYWSQFNIGRVQDFGNHRDLENKIKVAGVMAEQPALQKIEWLEASDNVPIFMMHGAKDAVVPFNAAVMSALTTYNGSNKDLHLFKLHGSKAMYDKIKTFSGTTETKGQLLAFEGISHFIVEVMKGQCAKLKGMQRGFWMEAFKFAKTIIDAKDNGVSPNIKNTYCLYKNPKGYNCSSVCQ